jgi:hypothetical protein
MCAFAGGWKKFIFSSGKIPSAKFFAKKVQKSTPFLGAKLEKILHRFTGSIR